MHFGNTLRQNYNIDSRIIKGGNMPEVSAHGMAVAGGLGVGGGLDMDLIKNRIAEAFLQNPAAFKNPHSPNITINVNVMEQINNGGVDHSPNALQKPA
jgi:hypothetical protein